MRVAITGPSGYVGRHVLAALAARGFDAVPVVRSPRGLAAEIVVGGLEDGRLEPAQLAGVDAIVHLAARTHVLNDTERDPLAVYRRVNFDGTRTLLDAALAADVKRVVFMSSIKAVGESSPPGRPIDSTSVPRPEDAYGVSKLEAETLLRNRCEAADVAWTIIRPPLVYGVGVKGNLPRLAGAIRRGIPLPFRSVRNSRSMIGVRNLADAVVTACTAPGAADQILTLCDLTVSTPELLRALANAMNARARLLPAPVPLLLALARATGRGAELRRLCGSLELDPADSCARLGWTPPVAPAEELRMMLAPL